MTDATGAPTLTSVEFFFDPTCPWAWMSSRWMMEVQKIRAVDVTWTQMSLAALNEGRDLDPNYADHMQVAWRYARVLAAAIRDHGEEITKPLYDALGTRIHIEARSDVDAVIAEALAEVGLPGELAQLADDTSLDDIIRAKQARVVELVGADVGTPTISIDGVAFFGPVITPAPKGEEAGRLFDGCVLVANTPGFYELKRTRTSGPIIEGRKADS
ncbi:mycothiol-dependent nitroreductase Rv2466c family protein [Kribbia dieselivorans]|uniref:mycothiol-dependent nitroreductase Rv2466c family protein n=1 Tax=Kribbia dieselivorans TaxID=331526 RepID=UPI000838B661|nr:DsbA family protein [Kribbia dieselivorans]